MRKLPHLACCVAVLIAVVLGSSSARAQETDAWRDRVVPTFMVISAASIAGLWTVDLAKGDKVDAQDGLWKIRDRETRELILPHLVAEYGTAAALGVGAYGLYADRAWGRDVALVALGALAYTSINSLGWPLTKEERLVYAIPMTVTLVGSGVSIGILLQ